MLKKKIARAPGLFHGYLRSIARSVGVYLVSLRFTQSNPP